MPRSFSPPFLPFIVFIVNGVANGQVEKLSCGQVCLSAQVTCTCTVTGSFLEWRVRNTAGTPQGQETLIPSELGEVKTLPLTAFEALLTNATGGSLTAILTFITLSDYEGFMIECETIGDLVDFTIAIPGPPLLVNNLQLAAFTTDSVMLAFTAPANSPCIANYTITTNASAPSSTTNTSVNITRPANDVEGDTYFVTITPGDFEGRMGPSSSVDCFMFSGPNAVIFIDDVRYEMQDGFCAAIVEWTAKDCLPKITSYNVTVNSSGETITEGGITPTRVFQLMNVTFGEEYFVTVTPSNTLGIGSQASTAFTVPTDCPAAEEPESPSSTPGSTESGSTTLLSSNFGGIAVLGATCIIAFAVSGICI